ncbi:MAG: hypothetical protein AVDCRST_MAG67-3953 [uncultured Solirubrobacteraceae bacterium]|uniref:Uncharacterized protein n=1 Tax=uncultured Solirubrobacteraceae bacterium TaxID=1162706 RepID=A0A6J4TPR4_9ACTN|nr:MAG: hypothetical protein AVDCRST_MAG67-3953 [uncultured Solirubrobacteraceae bacterium]
MDAPARQDAAEYVVSIPRGVPDELHAAGGRRILATKAPARACARPIR